MISDVILARLLRPTDCISSTSIAFFSYASRELKRHSQKYVSSVIFNDEP
jgi:hypothetical protein